MKIRLQEGVSPRPCSTPNMILFGQGLTSGLPKISDFRDHFPIPTRAARAAGRSPGRVSKFRGTPTSVRWIFEDVNKAKNSAKKGIAPQLRGPYFRYFLSYPRRVLGQMHFQSVLLNRPPVHSLSLHRDTVQYYIHPAGSIRLPSVLQHR